MTIVRTSLNTVDSARRTRFEPSGTIAATDVQEAIEELAAEEQPLNAKLTAFVNSPTTITSADGWIGIGGLTAPKCPISVVYVNGNAERTTETGSTLYLQGDDSGNANTIFMDGSPFSAIDLCSYNGTVAAKTAKLSGENVGQIIIQAYDGTSINKVLRFRAVATENHTASAHGTKAQIHVVANGSTTLAAKVEIDQDGALQPVANDGAALGKSANAFSDLFLATGAVVDLGAGDVTMTHAANSLAFAGASSGYSFDALLSVTAGQIKFPATANPSADVNTLDDYEEGTWTPALTFSTPGDLSVAYSVQVGSYTKIGNTVRVTFNLVTSSFTHTTASGQYSMSGLPFAVASVTNNVMGVMCYIGGWTQAGYSSVFFNVGSGGTTAGAVAVGSGVTPTTVTTTHVPTTAAAEVRGTMVYQTD